MKEINDKFIALCSDGNLDVVAMFGEPIVPDVNYLTAYGYRKACSREWVDIIEYLLTSHTISLEAQVLALKVVCRNGSYNSFRAITDNSNILSQLNQQEFYTCVQNTFKFGSAIKGRKLIIKSLLCTRKYMTEEQTRAAFKGVKDLTSSEMKDFLQAIIDKNTLELNIEQSGAAKAFKL